MFTWMLLVGESLYEFVGSCSFDLGDSFSRLFGEEYFIRVAVN
jgi:hypothetical protein